MAHLKWYFDTDDELNRILVRTTRVNRETLLIANWIGAVGWSRLSVHHANNIDDPRADSKVSVSRGTVDAFANLDDPDGGAMAIAKFLGIFSPWAFNGTGAAPKEGAPWYSERKRGKRKKKLRKGYGKKK